MSAFLTSINTVSYILNLYILYTLYTTLYNTDPSGVHQAVVVRAVVARAVARAVVGGRW